MSGQVPEFSIYLRLKCAKAINNILRLLYQVIIYKTYYYYYFSLRLKGLLLSYTTKELQLPDNSLQDLSLIRKELPPPIVISSRTKETPLNYITIKLSGESSLAKRVKLLDNRCSRRAFKRLSLIPEELLPPVNFLNKPTL